MSKMVSHEPFGHMQPKLWAKEGPGVKLAVWLLTTKSRELTSSRCLQMECDKAFESSRGELQLWFRPHSNRRSGPRVMNVQSPGSLTRDSFGHSSDIRNTRIFRRCSKRSIFKYFKIWKCEYVKYVNTMNKTLSKLNLSCAQTQRQPWSSIFKYFQVFF